jgi:HD-GYP domain-containing protein (c-di-GMP phosphodiesterase class II)
MVRVCLRPLMNAATLPDIRLSSGESKTIGRALTADVVIDEPSLSRLHARLSVDDTGRLTIEDLGSTNGILINGEPQNGGRLAAGDHVRFGFLEYLVDAERDAAGLSSDHTIFRMPVPDNARAVDRVALEALLATSRELMAFGDLPALLERVLDRLHAIVKSDRSAILLLDPATGELRPRAVRPAGAYTSVSDFASSTVVREALAAGESIVVYDTRLDARLQASESVAIAGVRSVICIPLFGRTGAIGALYADQLGITETFTPELVQYASAFGAHVATALETAQLYDDRERYFRATLEAFAKAIDARDHYTAGHSGRVTAYTLVLARHIGLAADQLDVIRQGGMLHDIGKVGVPDGVLLKKGPLDRRERAVMESHVLIGYSMLEPLPFIHASLPAIRGHHERWDGRGYPDRLARTDIHHHARLMTVADSFDAMTSARPYRAALSIKEAARRLRRDRGKQFDPAAIDAFDAVEAEFIAICESSRNTKVKAGR